MNAKFTRMTRLSTLEQTLFTIIAAWLSASSILTFANRNNPDYFTLKYAGLSGLFPLLILWILITGIYFAIQTLSPSIKLCSAAAPCPLSHEAIYKTEILMFFRTPSSVIVPFGFSSKSLSVTCTSSLFT